MNRGGKNNGIYAAETILKQRTKDGKVWYLMKWKGYSPRFNTWEPEENVLDDRLLKAYRKRLTDSKGKVKRKRSKQAEGEQSEDKSELDVDVEGVDSSNETALDEDESRDEDPSTSADHPITDSPRKWRKRRKTNGGDTSSLPIENDKENTETKEPLPVTPIDIPIEPAEDESQSQPMEEVKPELSVEIPNDDEVLSSTPAEPTISPVADPPSSPVDHDAVSVETSETTVQIPPDTNPISTHEDQKLDNKALQQHQKQPDKKSVLSKSSHFDFLANSIIITDVTTDRGTVTVKECSAYGDFFGPEHGKSQ